MPILTGFFSSNSSPALKITIKEPFTDGLEYDAILDTGFTGFLSIPLIEAIRLGLVLHGSTAVSFADGKQEYRLTARGMVVIQGESKIGVAIREPGSTEVLLGMGFLRLFEKAFFVSATGVILADEAELTKMENESPTTPPPPEQLELSPSATPLPDETEPSLPTEK